MQKKYLVALTEEEVQTIETILHRGKHTAQKRNRAHVLLLAHQGWTDAKIAEAVKITTKALEKLRQRFVEEGFETTLEGKPRGHRERVFDGRTEAHLIATVCSQAPEGHDRWTLRLLRDRLIVDLELKSLSIETIRQTLKKMNLNLGNE